MIELNKKTENDLLIESVKNLRKKNFTDVIVSWLEVVKKEDNYDRT